MKFTPASIEADHVLLTGPIKGSVELSDGTVVDVSPPVIAVTDDNAEEIAHLIGQRYAEEGHPDDVELDEESGEMVQRAFDYQAPKATKKKG